MRNPSIDIRLRKPPAPAYLKGWDLLRTGQLVNGLLGDLQVLRYFGDREDSGGGGGHGGGSRGVVGRKEQDRGNLSEGECRR